MLEEKKQAIFDWEARRTPIENEAQKHYKKLKWIIGFFATLVGKRDMSQRLLGSLQVDISKTRELLGWKPPVSVDAALKKTADAFFENK